MLWKIAWKNFIYKPLNTALCVSLLLFGVGIISLLLVIQHQLEQKFERDLNDIDLVLGAKGSPLQLVLSAVYHLDSPTGNIKMVEARKIMESPAVEVAIPLAYGDSYMGYRILGTTPAYLDKYGADYQEGQVFVTTMQAVCGSDVAKRAGLKIGDTFLGTHGEVRGGHVHDEHPYTVVGILNKTNSVLDQLVLTNLESVWQVHDENNSNHGEAEEHEHEGDHEHPSGEEHDHSGHDHDEEHHHGEQDHDHDHGEEHDHDDHGHSDHEHVHEHNERASGSEHDHDSHGHDHSAQDHDHDSSEHVRHDEHNHAHEHDHDVAFIADSMDITAVLLKYKTKMSVLNMPRIINEQTNMQAALPALEINRLFYMLGIGATTLKFVAGGIILMAGFSVFFVLFNRLRERKYELALMRAVGYRPMQLFGLLIIEGLLLAVVGYAFGWLLSRAGLYMVNKQAAGDFNLYFSSEWVIGEAWLLLLTVLVGIGAALIPAWRAMRMDISEVLSTK